MARIAIERTIGAPLEGAWAAAIDFMKSPHPSLAIIPEKQGDPKAHGAGAERTVISGKSRVRERLEEVSPSHYFTYRIVSGAPVRSHSGRVEFRPSGNTTVVKWMVEFTPKVPGTAWIVGKVMSGVINKFINALG